MWAPVRPSPSRSAWTRSVRGSTSSRRGSPLTTSSTRAVSGTRGKGGELLAQVGEVGLRVDRRRAGDALDRLLGRELAAEGVQVVAKPGRELEELARLHLGVEVGDRL